MEFKDLELGDLVELTLWPHAQIDDDPRTVYRYFYGDKNRTVNNSGRSYVGYIAEKNLEYLSLTSGWNKQTNRAASEVQSIRFYNDAIKSCSKIGRKK